MEMISCLLVTFFLWSLTASAFLSNSVTVNPASSNNVKFTTFSPLFMGRAAAVRAATKSKTDAKKAKTNALYGKKIIMAVKQGGPDPDSNRALADLIKAAKANSVPVDNINRAIKKASESNVGDFKESTFEAYGFGGASMVINVLTDNDNRANSDVRSTVGKNNGKMAEQGSVLFMYDKKGKIEVSDSIEEETLMDAAIEADIEDYELTASDTGEVIMSTVFVEPKDTNNMLEAIKSLGYTEGMRMALTYVPKAPVEVSDDDFENNMKIIDALEELDDVDSVEHNMSN